MDERERYVAALEHFLDTLRPLVEAWGKKDAEVCEEGEFEAVLALASVDHFAKEGK